MATASSAVLKKFPWVYPFPDQEWGPANDIHKIVVREYTLADGTPTLAFDNCADGDLRSEVIAPIAGEIGPVEPTADGLYNVQIFSNPQDGVRIFTKLLGVAGDPAQGGKLPAKIEEGYVIGQGEWIGYGNDLTPSTAWAPGVADLCTPLMATWFNGQWISPLALAAKTGGIDWMVNAVGPRQGPDAYVIEKRQSPEYKAFKAKQKAKQTKIVLGLGLAFLAAKFLKG